MDLERRGRVIEPPSGVNPQGEERVMTAKPFDIPKRRVWEAWRLVRSNAGAAGVDEESIEDFERDLKNNLYRVWNRMSSGSYFPQPVKEVLIPKKSGGQRPLGIPTVADRIAQTVVKLKLEPELEPHFHEDSYGYRPGKSAHQAISVTRQRCWWHDWVLEFDIRGLFDNIDHGLHLPVLENRAAVLVKAFEQHPERFVRGTPHVHALPTEVWINKPHQSTEIVLPKPQIILSHSY